MVYILDWKMWFCSCFCFATTKRKFSSFHIHFLCSHMIEIKLQLIKLYCKFFHVESFFLRSFSHSLSHFFPLESMRMGFSFFFRAYTYIFLVVVKVPIFSGFISFSRFFSYWNYIAKIYQDLFSKKFCNKMKDMNNIKGDSFQKFFIYLIHMVERLHASFESLNNLCFWFLCKNISMLLYVWNWMAK